MPNVLINGNVNISLGQSDYKAQGGEGIVYVKNNIAYKIYHEPKKMIPEGKILELQKIKTENVLAPKNILYNPKTLKAIGFTMPYVNDTEYLTKLFSKQFKNDHAISISQIIEIISKMQKQLQSLHNEKIIVGDYNEMNFLIDSSFSIPYHIDVDSYQTDNFPCTAIMDTIRDRRLPFGKFDDLSDWFSWAIVSFQVYTGIHPFKGKHPDYKINDLDERMKNNISVFNKEVKLPKSCQDFSMIPKNQLDWYKTIFINGDRSIPPIPGALGFVPGFIPNIISAIGKFKVDLINEYQENIIDVNYFNNSAYVITKNSIYCNNSKWYSFSKNYSKVKLANILGNDPIIAYSENNLAHFISKDNVEIGKIQAFDIMSSEGRIYTISETNQLIENSFEKIGKILHLTNQVAQLCSIYKVFEGVIIQDIFGKRYLTIPYEHQKCTNIEIPELYQYRIIDAKRLKNILILIGEKNGKYDKFTLFFNSDFNSYELKKELDISYMIVNFMIKQNGIIASVINEDTLELFIDNKKGSKELSDCPADINMKLIDGINKVTFINQNKLYSLQTT